MIYRIRSCPECHPEFIEGLVEGSVALRMYGWTCQQITCLRASHRQKRDA